MSLVFDLYGNVKGSYGMVGQQQKLFSFFFILQLELDCSYSDVTFSNEGFNEIIN